jgi:hypothetical protein
VRIPDPSFIASEELLWHKADGSQTKLTARVGMPYRVDGDHYRCPVELVGLDGRYPDVAGESSMQALCLATNLLTTRLRHLLEAGERVLYVKDDQSGSAWDVETLNAVFGR